MAPAADGSANLAAIVEQIILTSSDTDYLNQLIPLVRDARYADNATQLIHILNRVVHNCQGNIKELCNSNHQDFVSSVNRLLTTREGSASLTAQILELTEPTEESTDYLLTEMQALADSRNVRENINETSRVLEACCEVIRSANTVHEMLSDKNYYGALRSLQQLQDVHLRDVKRYKIAEVIAKSVPHTMQQISDSVMEGLHSWLFEIREKTQKLGNTAFDHTTSRLERQEARAKSDPYFSNFGLNSAVEIVADELDDFDFLQNKETGMDIDFSQLHEAIHIHEALGRSDWFRQEYAITRHRQMKLIIPDTLVVTDSDDALTELFTLLDNVIGFAIMEKFTMQHTLNLRPPSEVDELWETMSQSVISLVSNCILTVKDPKTILQIKVWIGLFTHTMTPWDYSISPFDSLTLRLFDQYIYLLKTQVGFKFEKIIEADGYAPMPVNTKQDYEQIIKQAWYKPEDSGEALQFPLKFPFSQMYPLACTDAKDFVDEIYQFPDEQLSRTGVIDQTAMFAMDELLREKICNFLIDRLKKSHGLKEVSQIYTNLSYFEQACDQIVQDLFSQRATVASTQPLHLRSKEDFQRGVQLAQKRVFDLVSYKMDALIETFEYDWESTHFPQGPSDYMQELIEYLSVSTMMSLPSDIKRLVFFDTLSRTCSGIVALPLDVRVSRINPAAVEAMAQDLKVLSEFVDRYVSQYSVVRDTLTELIETVALMQLKDHKLFLDSAYRNRYFTRVDLASGKLLIEKVLVGRSISAPQHPQAAPKASLSERLGFR